MSNMTIDRKRLAIVTGATRGIGWAIAMRLVHDGVDVIGTGTKPEGIVPKGCLFREVDFTNDDQTQSFIEELHSLAPTILVNNAGINKVDQFTEISPPDFDIIQHVNVTIPFKLCQAVIPGMRNKKWGRIVNISSIWGKISKSGRAPYSASKFALDGMTTALAAEVAVDGILANCIAPGFIDTEMTRSILGKQQMDALARQAPIQRLGKPEEIAAFVAWLVSSENSYISGQNIAIDGGFTRV